MRWYSTIKKPYYTTALEAYSMILYHKVKYVYSPEMYGEGLNMKYKGSRIDKKRN
jgi:hypothetical protein